ncbi:hypothetical protein [Wukongibacter sp. M2B1]|uniref:hypothetical protein n=1 Tax=Wukongibacter sp. M2B1 TaxID=3088895 RepID=UPI003D7BFADC
MSIELKNKCVFILGAGQIGTAVAVQLLKSRPKRIVLHTYTPEEANEAVDKLKAMNCDGIQIIASSGDIFLPYSMKDITDKEKLHSEENIYKLLNYYYSEPYPELLREYSIYMLIKRWKPDIIIDAINTATVFGDDCKEHINYIKNNFETNIGNRSEQIKSVFTQYLSDNFVPKLIHFVMSLKVGIEDFNIKKYIKVSTTGLGGMGMNLRFSHGDTVNYCLSNAIVGKVAAAGMLHQLLLSLSHTPGFDISVIVPAACVGWEETALNVVENSLGKIRAVDSSKKKFALDEEIEAYGTINEGEFLKIPLVYAGENKSYSLCEIATLTAYGQMESVTKEEVAEAVINNIEGACSKDLLAQMDLACIHSSYKGRRVRDITLHKLKDIEDKSDIPSIVTGNLGPTTAKHICELYLLKRASDNSITKLLSMDICELKERVHNEVLNNKSIRVQFLSVGLPIVMDNENILIGEKWMVPEENEDFRMTSDNIESWARKGWVDLRDKNILKWKKEVIKLLNDAERERKSGDISLVRDIYAINDDFDVGELLAYYYTLKGAGRRAI